jgi:hypothetical protein
VNVENDGAIVVQHPTAGIEHRLRSEEWLNDPVPLFNEPWTLTYGDVHEHFCVGESA